MATLAEYSVLTVPARLERLARTPDEVAAAVAGRPEDALGRRPLPAAWSPREIVCHLRDVEELFQVRFHTILGATEPEIFVLGAAADRLAPWGVRPGVRHPLDPEQWAEDRQYSRQDTALALAALRRRRADVLALLRPLSSAEWSAGASTSGAGGSPWATGWRASPPTTTTTWTSSSARSTAARSARTRRATTGGPTCRSCR